MHESAVFREAQLVVAGTHGGAQDVEVGCERLDTVEGRERLEIDATETAEMERRLAALADLAPEQATLAVEIATSQAVEHGSTQNYQVTREFRKIASLEERRQLITCLFAVAAADGSVSSAENDEIKAIGDELGLSRAEVAAVRARYRDKLAVLQGMPGR